MTSLTRLAERVDGGGECLNRSDQIETRQPGKDHGITGTLESLSRTQTLPRELLRRLSRLLEGATHLARHLEQVRGEALQLTSRQPEDRVELLHRTLDLYGGTHQLPEPLDSPTDDRYRGAKRQDALVGAGQLGVELANPPTDLAEGLLSWCPIQPELEGTLLKSLRDSAFNVVRE